MTERQKDMKDRLSRMQAILDQLDAETQRMREFEQQAIRQQKMQCYGGTRH